MHEGKSQGPWCPVLALFTHLLTFGKNSFPWHHSPHLKWYPKMLKHQF